MRIILGFNVRFVGFTKASRRLRSRELMRRIIREDREALRSHVAKAISDEGDSKGLA